MPMTAAPAASLVEALITAIRKAGHVNQGVMAAPAAILWPDADRQWEAALPELLAALPELLVFGDHRPELRQGPAIWIKWALSGRAADFAPEGRVPVIYLPGVSRAQLRAVETCARALQPLAELQYRGVFFSQASAKDWTVNAFLVARQGGLQLDVAQDRATQHALELALSGGVLLQRSLTDLQGKRLDAAFFQALLTPRPERDMLQWLSDPAAVRHPGDEARWEAFRGWCRDQLGFDPGKDDVVDGRERLCKAQDGWATVWEAYADQHRKVPHLYDKLLLVPSPPEQLGVFVADDAWMRYPSLNAEAENALAAALDTAAQATPEAARAAVLQAEARHAARRQSLWRQMGHAPLAVALESLAVVAAGTASPLGGETLEAQAKRYRDGAWRIDAAALQALADAGSTRNRDLIGRILAACYTPWLDESARLFQAAVQAEGGLGSRDPIFTETAPGTLTVFVDGLRYDVAEKLAEHMRPVARVALHAAWTSLPSVTASGKPWVSPLKAGVAGRATDTEFAPGVAATGQDLNAHHFHKLLAEAGVAAPRGLAVGIDGQAWIETGNIDHLGHQTDLELARGLDRQVADIAEKLTEVLEMGWSRVRVVTDHGWLLVPGGMPKVELAAHQAETRWGRCATLKERAQGTPLTFAWSWCPEVRIAMAPGIGSFRAGMVYAHGGLSLQEMLVPVLDLVPTGGRTKAPLDVKVAWKRLTCVVEAEGAPPGHRVDIRLKPYDPASSVAEGGKPLDSGHVRLLVTEDHHEGAAASVVVLDAAGEVVHKLATEIGG